jgi:hypothetical protein
MIISICVVSLCACLVADVFVILLQCHNCAGCAQVGRELGLVQHPVESTLRDMAVSLVDLGFAQPKKR